MSTVTLVWATSHSTCVCVVMVHLTCHFLFHSHTTSIYVALIMTCKIDEY